MMRRIIPILIALTFAPSAWAADNAVIVTPGVGVTMKSKDIGAGVQAMQPVLSDTGGNALATPTAGADGASNTSTGLQIYARPSWWNGVTWDRAPGDVTNGAFVNVKTGTLATVTNLAQMNGAALLMGNGATGTGSQRVTIASDNTAFSVNAVQSGTWNVATVTSVTNLAGQTGWAGGTLGAMANYGTSPGAVLVPGVNAFITNTNANGVATAANSSPVVSPVLTNAGAAVVKGGTAVVNGGSFYQAVAASQTATVLQSSTGAAGDYLSHCVLYPTSTSPGVVTVFDNTNAAAGSAILFPGGATSLSNLAPISIPVGAVSTAGAWKVTTGASISVVCYGKFS